MGGIGGMGGLGRILIAAAGAAGLVMGAGQPAAAREPAGAAAPAAADVAAAIAEVGWYADDESAGDREQLGAVAERLAGERQPMGFALLAEEPPASSTAYAEDVLDALIARGERSIRTVVVLSDADVGVVSDVWSDRAIDGALDETIDDLRADPTDGIDALADALAAQPTGFDDAGGDEGVDVDDDDGGSSSGLLVLAGVGVVGIVLASRALRGAGGESDGDTVDDESSGWGRSRWQRSYRRRSSFRSSLRSSRSRRRSSGGSRRRSSSGSRRGRGGRRL